MADSELLHDGRAAAEAWRVVSRAQFVALTTYRRNGEGITKRVWIAPDGDTLVLTTEANVGKVKRLRNDPRVRLQPCSRFGAVEPGAPTVDGRCFIAGPDRDQPSANAALRRKYGLQFTLILTLERSIRRAQRRSGERLILRISPERAGGAGADRFLTNNRKDFPIEIAFPDELE